MSTKSQKILHLVELCSQSANCSRTLPKTGLSVTKSFVYEAVATQSARELSHDYVVDEWCITSKCVCL